MEYFIKPEDLKNLVKLSCSNSNPDFMFEDITDFNDIFLNYLSSDIDQIMKIIERYIKTDLLDGDHPDFNDIYEELTS